MLLITVLAAAATVALAVALLADLVSAHRPGLRRRLAEIRVMGSAPEDRRAALRRRRRLADVERMIEAVGRKVPVKEAEHTRLQTRLLRAGFDHPLASVLFTGIRLVGLVVLAIVALAAATLLAAPRPALLAGTTYAAALGWLAPGLVLRVRTRRRQREIRRVLPDALDLLVVCVEAGLALNQALLRVAADIADVSRELSRELALTNLQIRAGTPRIDALQSLAARTGLPEIQSLVGTLVQTDRFGTSVARSLRVHARTLRTERRQAAEEAAAKTAIKMVFPLVLCIFPALFVVILGPGMIDLMGGFLRGGF